MTGASLLACAVCASAPSALRGDGQNCRTIRGTFNASVVRILPTLGGWRFTARGTSTGDLAGPLVLTIRKTRSEPGASRFELSGHVGTGDAEVELSGGGIGRDANGGAQGKSVFAHATLHGDGDASAGLDGRLTGQGVIRVELRELELAYTGVLCATRRVAAH